MKKIIFALCLVLLYAVSALADYTIEIKNAGGTVRGTKVITSLQVQHLQKMATRNGVSTLDYFWNSIDGVLRNSLAANKANWIINNQAYIEDQSKD